MDETSFKQSSQNNRRIAKNTLMLYFRMILSMLVTLYTSRVVLNVLGVEDFGIYNVVGGVVTMFGFFNGAMASATQRFLSYEIGRNNFGQLKKTFNVAQIIHVCIGLLIFILAETIGLWFVNNYLNIPTGRMEAARWIYHFAVLSFLVSIIQVPYNAVIIARERMDVYAYVSILEVSLKLLIVFMLKWIVFDKLKLYGILIFVVTCIIASIYRIYCRKNFNETAFEIVKEKSLYRTLVSYSGWNLFGNIAAVAKGQGITIILNIFFGTIVNAAQGVSNQVNGAVQSFVFNFQTAVNPQIIKSYAADNKEYMTNLIIQSAKFSFYLLFILALPIILEIDIILRLWLKTIPEYTALFTVLILINALIESMSGSLMTAVQATGKIRAYQLVVGTLLILILPVSYLFFKLDYPPDSTFVVCIFISIIALIVRLYFIRRYIPEFHISRFLGEILLKNIPIVAFFIALPMAFRVQMSTGWLRLVLVFISSVISCATVIYLIGLNRVERKYMKRCAQKIFSVFKLR